MATLQHRSLRATLQGVTAADGHVWQFRGLQYARIPARFAVAERLNVADGACPAQCTSYGPRCPQNGVDFRHLLRIPGEGDVEAVAEDEFACLNLDVTVPAVGAAGGMAGRACPVLVWIHGGSQTVTFGSSASGLCDPTNLVRTSVEKEQPIIVVTLNYRLNIFAFGDGSGARNLALSDQRAALDFIKEHIGDFGGDPNNITLAGESAGAVYVHAHMVMGAPIQQGILQSGSLHLSPPLPEAMAQGVVDRIQGVLSRKTPCDLKTASVADLLAAQAKLGIASLFLQMEPALADWENKLGSAERLLIGDCEYESSFFRTGIEAQTAASIAHKFDSIGAASASLKALYNIIPSRPTSCKLGALDFLHDARFTLATERIVQQWRADGRPVFRYLVDEANPWQPSSRAHHGVDLVLLFGGFDLEFSPGAGRVSARMAHAWIEFVARLEPWRAGGYFAFGPLGECGVVDEEGFAARRRQRHCGALGMCDRGQVDAMWKALAAGNISLEN